MARKSPKKSWGQQRAFNKMRITGMLATLRQIKGEPTTTRTEQAWANDAMTSLSYIIEGWEKNAEASKKKFREVS